MKRGVSSAILASLSALFSMIIWVPIWFVIVILVTTLNKTLFTSLKCPYPVTITMVVCVLQT